MYIESKKEIDKIASKYNCKGNIILRIAIQYIVEYGQYMFKDEEFIKDQKQQVNDRHDLAEKDGKNLWTTRDFEMTILNCAIELAEINTYDLIIYMQKEMFWSNEGGLDYQRAIQLLQKSIEWIITDISDPIEAMNDVDIEEDELRSIGFDWITDLMEEKEKE